jgi:beta-mannosidase
VKGANWIPADAFESRVTADVIDNLLQSAVDANMNTVRNWGGGIYQQEYFYTVADRLGLMVWQEFMFACAMYPRDSAFLENVSEEITYQIRRLSHHVSIILWSGNNENEAAVNGWYPEVKANELLYAVDYSVLYLDTVMPAVKKADPSRMFWPSSPSNGLISESPPVGRWADPGSSQFGDVHYYNYNADCTNVTILPRPRFASEYGFQSSPSIFAWQQVTDSSNFAFNGTFANHREHGSGGVDEQLLIQMRHHFLLPNDINNPVQFENYIYLSQCMQALCIKSESEHYRRTKGDAENTMGAIYWQLNDIWQAQTWSSLEYGGRWKMLHYYAKRFFAPFLVSSYESPLDHFGVYATSDLNKDLSGKLSVTLWNWAGKALNSWNVNFNVSKLGSVEIFRNSIAAIIAGRCSSRADCFLYLSATDQSGEILSTNVFFLSSLTQALLPTPNITLAKFTQTTSTTISFVIAADQVSPYVFLQTKYEGVFSDNGFLLLPNTPVALQFVARQPLQAGYLQP